MNLVYCSGLSVTGPHKLIGNDPVRRCGFGGVGVAFLEEVCHCMRAGFEVSYIVKIHPLFQVTS